MHDALCIVHCAFSRGPMTPTPPESIGRYRIVDRLASGGGGEVYKGFDPVLQRPLAIKLLRVRFEQRPAASVDRIKERFYREIQRVAALVHPAIARLFDGGETPGGFFMASEFVEGASLAEAAADHRSVDIPARVAYLRQIAEALEYARERDTPHLNLKPTNVLVCPDRTLKVGGFGVARVLEAITVAGRDASSPQWTTPFTAPEFAAGQAADARADVYSFAAVAVALFGGAAVAPRDGAPARWVEDGSLPALPVLAADSGAPAAAAVLARGLSVDVDRRYPTALTCFEALNAALGFSSGARRRSWETPSAAAGMTVDQLKQIDGAATQPGVPTFIRKADGDLEDTFADSIDQQASTQTIAPGTHEPPAADSASQKTTVMSAAVSDVSLPGRKESPGQQPKAAPSAESTVPDTVFIPRAQPITQSPRADAPPPSTALPLNPSELKTTIMPAPPKPARLDRANQPPAAPAPFVAGAAGDTILIPRKAPPPPSSDQDAGETVLLPRISERPEPEKEDSGRTIVLSPAEARGLEPQRPQPRAAAPAAKAAAPSTRKSAGTRVVLLLLGVIVLVAIGAAAFLYVPAVRQLWSRQALDSSAQTSSLQPPTATTSQTPVNPPPVATAPDRTTASTEPSATSSTTPPAEPGPPIAGGTGASTSTPATAAVGTVRVTSTPSGANVSVDGRRRGVTPLRLGGLLFGDHDVEVALDGYKAERQRVSLSAERASRVLDVKLTKTIAAPTTGAVSVITDPAGARILVDGAAAGNAPLTVANLAPGKHAVQAERDGFESATRDVDVKAGTTASVTIHLNAAARPAPPATPVGPLPFEVVEVKPRLVRGEATPPYPRAAAQIGLAGVVQIAWIVDETGAVSDVQVIEASAKVFEIEVVAWARSLRYEPGRQAGKPVKVRIVRRFSFQRSR